jgi:glycosyltransferase involved in cell wall biosynthesis
MIYRFSIVVPTLNRREMLDAALASIRAQHYPDVEIIVVDGGSTDGTLEALREQRDIKLLNGPDAGVYDAFNKGIACATGDIVGILNSDDSYEPGTFDAVSDALDKSPNAHAACGTALLVEQDRVVMTFDREADKVLASPRTTLIGSCIPNARFFRRSAMAQVGLFSLEYRFVGDRDWLTRWYEAGMTTVAVAQPVYRYGQHAGSLTFDHDRRSETVIRIELIALAQRWRTAPNASAETRRIAELLEGRCRSFLAVQAARTGRMSEAIRWLFHEQGRAIPITVRPVARAGIDWFQEKFRLT